MSIIFALNIYYGDQIKKDELLGAFSMCSKMRNSYRVLVVNLKGRVHLENQSMDGILIVRWSFKNISFRGRTERLLNRVLCVFFIKVTDLT